MSSETTALTPEEASRLAELELIIERAEYDRGEALLEVKESRLYRQDYDTFEQYCRKRWDISGDYGSKLARHARRNQTIVGLKPTNEAQSRELDRLDSKQSAAVMKRAMTMTKGQKVTANIIRQARAEVIKVEPPKRYMPTSEEKRRRMDEEVRLWSEGYHREDICKMLGISASTLNMDLAARGVSGKRPVAGMKPKGHPMEIIEWRSKPEEGQSNVIKLTLVPGRAACDLDRESADRMINNADSGTDQLAHYVNNGYELTESQLERLEMIRARISALIDDAEEARQKKGAG